MIKVFGHISPDTDATGSAIIYAWYLNEIVKKPAEAFVLGSLNKETAFVLNKWQVKEPSLLESLSASEEVVIVDTNNPQELLPETESANILHIIDHHRLAGGLSTKGPLEITLKPFASTASVIYSYMNIPPESLPREIAGIILSCILSDTLAFRSPTTTPYDKELAEKLAQILGVDIANYSSEMFKAKSDLSDFSDLGLLHIDSKKSELDGKNIRISVVETTDPSSILARKAGIITAIENLLKEEPETSEVLFFIIDILKEEATVLTYNDFTKSIVETSFGVTVSADTHVLPGVVSRKKQIIPVLKLTK